MLAQRRRGAEREVHVDRAEFDRREQAVFRPNQNGMGLGRELFGSFRSMASGSEAGGSIFSALVSGGSA